MSLSKPSTDSPNPCTRWHEWDGSNGAVRYYDKSAPNPDPAAKRKTGVNVVLKLPFYFILLDELTVIKGWHEPSQSGISSNEVRDCRENNLVVKAFKGGLLANGLYNQIKDRVKACGGYFTSNLYLATPGADRKLHLTSIQFAGAALNAWVDFKKENREALSGRGDVKGVKITGYKEGKKGKIIFRTPVFELMEIKPETIAQAVEIDRVLQTYLDGYFKRTGTERAEHSVAVDTAVQPDPDPDDDQTAHGLSGGQVTDPGFSQLPPDDDDAPF